MHLHGSILHDRCHAESCGYRERIDPAVPQALRSCPRCGAALRPAVVWFGESLPDAVWNGAQRLCASVDCLLVVGTSATVYPAAGLIALARERGARIVVVDPNPNPASAAADVFVRGSAAAILPDLLAGLELVSTAD